jgi:hypothetical protein
VEKNSIMATFPPIGPIIPNYNGYSFSPTDPGYASINDIYATSTYGKERDMNPGDILEPTNVADIIAVVKAANERRQKLAIRTGGHQYSGASSTTRSNLQLNLKRTFLNPFADLKIFRKDGKTYLRTSVSWALTDLFKFTLQNKVFLPTGQCITVCLGGHAQTGGYGMFSRSLGLLADYIQSLETVSPTGVPETIEKGSEKMFGFLGGSPGNMGVIHHLTVEVQEDSAHPNSRGDRILLWYNKENYKAALDIMVERSQDPKWSRNYDLTVNIYSENFPLSKLFSGAKRDKLQHDIPDEKIDDGNLLTLKVPIIIIYLQWINLDKTTYDDSLLRRIEDISIAHITIPSSPGEGVSSIASQWLFDKTREYPYPYVKRCNVTDAVQPGWSTFMSEQMDKIVAPRFNGLFVSSQLQVMGGRLRENAGNGTAYCWRNATLGGTWDVFYQPGKKDAATAWQAETDKGLFGPKGVFCKDERRLLWGSYGDWDLSKERGHYYEPGVFERVQKIRTAVDPNDVFSPNPFCVPVLK